MRGDLGEEHQEVQSGVGSGGGRGVEVEEQHKVLIRTVCCVSAGSGEAELGLVGRESLLQVVGGTTGEGSDFVCKCVCGTAVSLAPAANAEHCGLTTLARRLEGVARLDQYVLLGRSLEEDGVEGHPGAIAEFLQCSDTAVIYPEAPEEQNRLGTPEEAGPVDEEEEEEQGRGSVFLVLEVCVAACLDSDL